ncbi:hypothetical protein [Ruegeria arenilitoris]|uniref:hypothetical protein n=1 Tax=Ruegeria arenilitoris TaxID=1173585 RepID=UPI0014814AB2|nr:hypothetical protein [Ruegeria arenilitoris]
MGFLQGYTTQKLKQNQRSLKDAFAHINKLSHERNELQEELEDYDCSIDKRKCDLEARIAREDFLMSLLDEAYGKDENPARQSAYADDVDFRIPIGDRKGEIVTQADHVYLTKYAEEFNEKFASKWKEYAKNWVEFLHEKISI